MSVIVSNMTGQEIGAWLGYEEDEMSDGDIKEFEELRDIAIAHIKKYTGQEAEYLDNEPDICHAVRVLIQDMHDNRSFYVESDKVNTVAQSIMDLHRKMTL